MTKLLITGGTGSFGEAALRHFLDDKSISEIVIFSRDELKQHLMRTFYNDSRITFIVGDIRDKDALLYACSGIDIVFHAAAFKQVLTGEEFPIEMVKTNIIGTENLLQAAVEKGVKKVIILSTDKAVEPVSIMGMTKAIAERAVLKSAKKSKSTIFCIVRYGNVLTSRGSVVPVFMDLIEKGKVLPIFNSNLKKFIITLEDAISLVDLAIKKGKQGDIFIKKASAVTIKDLAQAVKIICHSDIDISEQSMRYADKMYETLATSLEMKFAEDLGDYLQIKTLIDGKSIYLSENINSEEGGYTSEFAPQLTVSEIEKMLLSTEYIKKRLKNH